MADNFTLTLDTTAPQDPSISLASGSQYTTEQLIDATISTSDADTTGYQMLIWGDVDTTQNPDIQDTEGASSWITYSTTQQVKLDSGDGSKEIFLKIRDDVMNESAQASDTITLDATLPTVTIATGPDADKISKISGADEANFSFTVDEVFDEYKVKVVPATSSSNTEGTLIGTTNGSSNMDGTEGDYPAETAIDCTITGADLEEADTGDGEKIIKVFAKDQSGNWSA